LCAEFLIKLSRTSGGVSSSRHILIIIIIIIIIIFFLLLLLISNTCLEEKGIGKLFFFALCGGFRKNRQSKAGG
jgi:hypothetical protein